jgi:hypothetical protein
MCLRHRNGDDLEAFRILPPLKRLTVYVNGESLSKRLLADRRYGKGVILVNSDPLSLKRFLGCVIPGFLFPCSSFIVEPVCFPGFVICPCLLWPDPRSQTPRFARSGTLDFCIFGDGLVTKVGNQKSKTLGLAVFLRLRARCLRNGAYLPLPVKRRIRSVSLES